MEIFHANTLCFMAAANFFLICSLVMPEFNVPQHLACITCKMEVQVQIINIQPFSYTWTQKKSWEKAKELTINF